MARAKRSLFTALGWIVWKLLSVFGLKIAKDKLKDHERAGGRSSRR